MPPCAAARLSRLPHPRAAIKVGLPRADFRPGVKDLSLIDDDSAVLAVGRPGREQLAFPVVGIPFTEAPS